MIGTVAITDQEWYEYLLARPRITEVNFWRPAPRTFNADRFAPFFFKLRAPHNAICGFAFFAQYSRLPIWLAWETFGEGNGAATIADMKAKIVALRRGIRYGGDIETDDIGCILLVQPVFFPPHLWVRQPDDWKPAIQVSARYDLSAGEGLRVWTECQQAAEAARLEQPLPARRVPDRSVPRYGDPVTITPRLGQRSFRVAVLDAYGRACAATTEHSLPVLEAAHIRPFANEGPHETANGVLLRADLHRLFDTGYLTITPSHRIEVSGRLKRDFENGRTYYPLQGQPIHLPSERVHRPAEEFLRWHNDNVFRS